MQCHIKSVAAGRCVDKDRASSHTLQLRAPCLSSGSLVQEIRSVLFDLVAEVVLVVRMGALEVEVQFVLMAKKAIGQQFVEQHGPLIGRSVTVDEEELIPEHARLALPNLRLLCTLQEADTTGWHLKPQLVGVLWRCTECL